MNNIDNIITNKDLIYLKDLFTKNYNLFNELNTTLESINNKEVKEIIERIRNMHEDHMYFIISSLKKENYFEDDDYE